MNRKYQRLGDFIAEVGDRRVAMSRIRAFARQWNKHLLDQPCEHCGHTFHVELCHIKPVSTFKDDAVLLAINTEQNCAVLCSNCHVMFDRGALTLNDFRMELD